MWTTSAPDGLEFVAKVEALIGQRVDWLGMSPYVLVPRHSSIPQRLPLRRRADNRAIQARPQTTLKDNVPCPMTTGQRVAYYSIDPFPDIAPSLLNSVDIIRYANKGCLVQPFSSGQEAVESCNVCDEVPRNLVYVGTKRRRTRCMRKIDRSVKGEQVRLKANSIAYLEDRRRMFRLPQYIAARFNLHIRSCSQGDPPWEPVRSWIPGFVGPAAHSASQPHCQRLRHRMRATTSFGSNSQS